MFKKAFALGLIAGLGIAIVLPQSSQAQQPPSSADLLKDPQSQDPLSDLLNNRGNNSTTGLMQLLQRVSQGSTDPEAFRQQQAENLDAATAAFLNKRRQLLQQSQPAPVAPAPTGQPFTQPVK